MRETLVTEIDILKEEELVLSQEIIAWREEVERRRLEITIREEVVQTRVRILRETVVEMADKTEACPDTIVRQVLP